MDNNSKKNLNKISAAILKLVTTVDEQFNLTDEEADIVIHSAWDGLNKVLDRRYKEVKNRRMIHQDREY